MTNSLNSDQELLVLKALQRHDEMNQALIEYMDAHARWIEAFEAIWDNNDGDGPMWAEYLRLKDDT